MKIKTITLYALFLPFLCLFASFDTTGSNKKNLVVCNLTLTNSKTNRSVKICDKITPVKIEFYLGISKSVDKESEGNGDDGIITITYDGLVIELQNEYVKNITITNKKWKLNTFSIGTPIDQVLAKHEQIMSKYFSDMRFKIEDAKGVLFAEIDEGKKIKKLGVSFIR